ncbi:MAG: asparagine--tRNA ligase [Flavobacteriales bacterium]|nr:asparagine--tRNA ligase [Flavobacteriales bacterium]|tara:strand:- start:1614 stop:3053 length:1440 start_codon:yes stop_codon:yes gene_type:complete
MKRTKIKSLLNKQATGQEVCVKGWVRTRRGSKNVSFIALNDGSTINNIQIVAEGDHLKEEVLKRITTGSAISVIGILVESKGVGQNVEVLAAGIDILGESDPDEYPLQPKKHSLDFLREKAHLRFRTNTFSAVFRLRHALTFAVHKFFNDKGFVNIHTPIITGADAEGAGEMFQVTNLNLEDTPKVNGKVDYTQDFFNIKTNLTVSGQLEAELGALSLGQVYTFGPTFRAENSNTSRHLSEFWMIEPEVAFADLEENMDLAEEFLKYCIQYCITNCEDDLRFLDSRLASEEKSLKKEERFEMGLLERLQFVIENDFERLTYSDAIDLLINSKPNKKKKFKYIIEGFGSDLQSEHERYLVEKKFKKPVIITDFPKGIKAFYMKQNEDNETVRAMDILFPLIGEIVGGSQREEDLNKLSNRMEEMEICKEELWWYLETRKFGTCVHSGFGLGFERLIMFVTGMKNIRDVIPFPRTPQNADF